MRSLLLSALAFSLIGTASAQPDWRAPGPGVSLDVVKHLDYSEPGSGFGSSEIGVLQSLQILSARVPVGAVTVTAELPLAYADLDACVTDLNGFCEVGTDGDAGLQGFGVGTPSLGVQVQRGAFRIGLGVRAPLASDRAGYVGFLADAERPEATLPDHASTTLSIDAARLVYRDVVRIRLRFAPTALVYTGDGIAVTQGPDPELAKPDPWLAVAYGAAVEGDVGPAALSLGLVGYEESRNGRGFGFASVRGGVTLDAGAVRPGLSFRTRITDTGPPEPVVGLSLDVPLR